MDDVQEKLIQMAKKEEKALQPLSGVELIENLLALTVQSRGATHAMKVAAYKASEYFGSKWTEKEPSESRDVQIREMLRQMVLASGDPKDNGRHMRWRRFQEFGRHTYLDQVLDPPSNKKSNLRGGKRD